MVLLSVFIFYRLLFSALYILFGISVLMVVVCWCVKLRKKFRIRRQKQAKNSPSKEVARLLQRTLQFTLQNFVNFTRVVAQTDASVSSSGLQCCIFLIFAFAISTFSLIFAQRYITLATP